MVNIIILGKNNKNPLKRGEATRRFCPFILQRGENEGKCCGLINKKCQNNSHIKYRMIKENRTFRVNHPEIPLIVGGKIAYLKTQKNFLQLIYK